MTEHLRLIEITKSILESNGYDVKLEQTIRYKDSWIDIDIVAKNTKQSIAIEVGNTDPVSVEMRRQTGVMVGVFEWVLGIEGGR